MSKRLIFGLLLAVSLHAFDELVLIISLPTIVEDLGGEQWYGLSLAAFMLASLVSVAWAGDWIDQHGPSTIFRLGLICFASGLILACLAPSMMILIAARALQGIGGGIAWTTAYSVMNRLSSQDIKSRMVAMLDSAWLLPSLLAPAVGGVLIDLLNWRWVFAIQLPLLALVYFLAAPQISHLTYTPKASDYTSLKNALKIGIYSGLLIWIVSRPMDVLWLTVPILLFALWGPINRVLPAGWLRLSNPLAVSVVILAVSFFAFYGMETFLPLFLIEQRGFSTSAAGLLFTFGAFSWVAASFGQSWLDQRISQQHSMLIGLALLLVTLALIIAVLNPSVPATLLYLGWTLAGFGMGLAFNAAATAAMLATTPGKEGATASATGVAETLAIALASGMGGAIKNQVTFQGGGLEDALLVIWCAMGAVLLLGLWIVWRRFPAERLWHQSTAG